MSVSTDIQTAQSLVGRATRQPDMEALRQLNILMQQRPPTVLAVQKELQTILAQAPVPQKLLCVNLIHSLLVTCPGFRLAIGSNMEWHNILTTIVASPGAPQELRNAVVRMLQATSNAALRDLTFRPFAMIWTNLVQRGYIRFVQPNPPPVQRPGPPAYAMQSPPRVAPQMIQPQQPMQRVYQQPPPPPPPVIPVQAAAKAPAPQQPPQQQPKPKPQSQPKPKQPETQEKLLERLGIDLVQITVEIESLKRVMEHGDLRATGVPMAAVKAAEKDAVGIAKDLFTFRKRLQAAISNEQVLAHPSLVSIMIDTNTNVNNILDEYQAFTARCAYVGAYSDSTAVTAVERLSSSFLAVFDSAAQQAALQQQYDDLASTVTLPGSKKEKEEEKGPSDVPLPDNPLDSLMQLQQLKQDADQMKQQKQSQSKKPSSSQPDAQQSKNSPSRPFHRFVPVVEFPPTSESSSSSSSSSQPTQDILAPTGFIHRAKPYGLAQAYTSIYGCDSL